MVFSLGPPRTNMVAGFNYKLCYCADFPGGPGSCDVPREFQQDAGSVIVLMASFGVTDRAVLYSQRVSILPVTRFTVDVHCGGRSCPASTSRLKIVSLDLAHATQWHWTIDASTGCNAVNQSALIYEPLNCLPSSDSDMHGECLHMPQQTPTGLFFNDILLTPRLSPGGLPIGFRFDLCFSHNPDYNRTSMETKTTAALQTVSQGFFKLGELVMLATEV